MGKAPLLMISYEYPPAVLGGIGKVTYDRYRMYKTRGHRVFLVAPAEEGEDVFSLPAKGNLKKFLLALWRGGKIAFRYRPRLIYATSGTYAGMVALLLSCISGIPYVVMAHGNEFIRFVHHPLIAPLIRMVYRHATYVFAVSSFIRDRLLEFGLPPDKVRVVHNWIDSEEWPEVPESRIEAHRKRLGLSHDTFVLLTVSRLEKRKGHDVVIKALARLLEEQIDLRWKVRYLIVGTGPEEPTLRNLVRSYHLEDVVEFVGKIPYEDLPIYYSLADVFVMPSKFLVKEGSVEGFGLVFLEASLYGLPLVGGKKGGAVDIIVSGETGFLVDPSWVDEVKKIIQTCLDNPILLKQMGKKAHERTLQHFLSSQVFEKEYSLVRGIVKS